MRVLVLGGAGFLGSHLVERYVRDGHVVVAVDNLSTGDVANLDDGFGRTRGEFVLGDVTKSLFGLGAFDLVLHFASPASPIHYERLALETLATNSLGTRNACDLALACGARLVYASTSEVYGDPLVHPQNEEYWGNVNPTGVRACYDEAKRFGEALVSTMTRRTDLDARIVRIFNTYGPRMGRDDGRAIPNFIEQALGGGALSVYGDGSQTRSFTYVDDLVEGIVRLASRDVARGTIVNIGNPEETSIAELAATIADIAGVPFATRTAPLPQDDPKRRKPDISLARKLLGWEPRVTLRDGLARTIEWCRAKSAWNAIDAQADPTLGVASGYGNDARPTAL